MRWPASRGSCTCSSIPTGPWGTASRRAPPASDATSATRPPTEVFCLSQPTTNTQQSPPSSFLLPITYSLHLSLSLYYITHTISNRKENKKKKKEKHTTSLLLRHVLLLRQLGRLSIAACSPLPPLRPPIPHPIRSIEEESSVSIILI